MRCFQALFTLQSWCRPLDGTKCFSRVQYLNVRSTNATHSKWTLSKWTQVPVACDAPGLFGDYIEDPTQSQT